jgi:hypothetical protein
MLKEYINIPWSFWLTACAILTSRRNSNVVAWYSTTLALLCDAIHTPWPQFTIHWTQRLLSWWTWNVCCNTNIFIYHIFYQQKTGKGIINIVYLFCFLILKIVLWELNSTLRSISKSNIHISLKNQVCKKIKLK